MKTPGSRKCSVSRMRSPSRAPLVNGDDGSIDSTATVALALAGVRDQRADQRRLADARRPGEADDRGAAGLRVDLAHQLPALGVVVLDQRDRARERALVARQQVVGQLGGGGGARSTSTADPMDVRRRLLVRQRFQHVELRGAPRRPDRGEHAGERRQDRGGRSACTTGIRRARSPRRRAAARPAPRRRRRARCPSTRADQRGDHRLVADHPPAPGAATCRSRAACPSSRVRSWIDSDERVDDAEQRHDHRQREQRVDQAEELVDLLPAARPSAPPGRAPRPTGSRARAALRPAARPPPESTPGRGRDVHAGARAGRRSRAPGRPA